MILSLVEFQAYVALSRKSKEETSNEYQPILLKEKLIENNHDNCMYPKSKKLTNLKETLRYQKVKNIFRYHFPNKLLFPENVFVLKVLKVSVIQSYKNFMRRLFPDNWSIRKNYESKRNNIMFLMQCINGIEILKFISVNVEPIHIFLLGSSRTYHQWIYVVQPHIEALGLNK